MYRTGHPFLPHVYHTVNFRFLLHQIEYEFGVAFVTHQLSLQPRITPHKLKKGRFPEKKITRGRKGAQRKGGKARRGKGREEEKKGEDGGGVGWEEDGRREVVGLRKFKIPFRKKACP